MPKSKVKSVKGFVVLEHADGTVNGASIFTGRGAKAAAKEHFIALVVEDLESQHDATQESLDEDQQEDFDLQDAQKEANRLAKLGTYTSESLDNDIVIVECR